MYMYIQKKKKKKSTPGHLGNYFDFFFFLGTILKTIFNI